MSVRVKVTGAERQEPQGQGPPTPENPPLHALRNLMEQEQPQRKGGASVVPEGGAATADAPTDLGHIVIDGQGRIAHGGPLGADMGPSFDGMKLFFGKKVNEIEAVEPCYKVWTNDTGWIETETLQLDIDWRGHVHSVTTDGGEFAIPVTRQT